MIMTTQPATSYIVCLKHVEQEVVVGEFSTRAEAEDLIASKLGPDYKPADFYVQRCNGEIH